MSTPGLRRSNVGNRSVLPVAVHDGRKLRPLEHAGSSTASGGPDQPDQSQALRVANIAWFAVRPRRTNPAAYRSGAIIPGPERYAPSGHIDSSKRGSKRPRLVAHRPS